jgi:hypothetical protein
MAGFGLINEFQIYNQNNSKLPFGCGSICKPQPPIDANPKVFSIFFFKPNRAKQA